MPVNAAPVRTVAPDELSTNQVSVTTTPTLIVDDRPSRRGVLIINGSNTVLYLGGITVSASNGLRILGVEGTGIMIPTQKAIYGVVASGFADVSYMELY